MKEPITSAAWIFQELPSTFLQGTSFFNGITWGYFTLLIGLMGPYLYLVGAHLVSLEGHPVDGLHRDARDADRPGDWQGEDEGERRM